MNRLERILSIMCIVTRSYIKVLTTDMRSDYLLITITFLNLLQEVFQTQAQGSSLRQPNRQSLTYTLREHEQFHLLTDFTVIALLGLFYQCQIFIKQFLFRERNCIYTSHLRTFLVTTPVSRRYGHYLHGLNRSCRKKVRTTAQICKVTLSIGRNMSVFQFFNQLILICLSFLGKESQSIGLGDFLAHNSFLTLGHFDHFLFDLGKVCLTDDNTLRRHHVVIETVLNSRTDTELHARIEFLQSLCQQVGRSMPESMLAFW